MVLILKLGSYEDLGKLFYLLCFFVYKLRVIMLNSKAVVRMKVFYVKRLGQFLLGANNYQFRSFLLTEYFERLV